jgi:AcrR family transcriptional regulator
MSTLRAFTAGHDLTLETLCGEIFDRHGETIQVQKRHLAVPNLARIVGAALKLANSTGFEAMSLRDLSKEAGLSMGALYAYFDSKETLLMMILGEVNAVLARIFETPPELAADPVRRLRWLVRTHVFLTETMQPWFIFAFMEARAFGEQARAYVMDSELTTENLFFTVLEDGLARGLFSVDNPRMTAALIKPMLQDWYVKRWKHRRRKVTPEAYASFVIAFIEAAIRAPSTP